MFKIDELLSAVNGRLVCGKLNSRVEGISIDSRTIRPGFAFAAIKGKNFDGHNFIKEAIKKGAKAVLFEGQGPRLKAQGAVSFIEVKDTTKALGDIARFQRNRFNIPVVAVTGSNGKTTTKDMIAWCLSHKFNVLKNEGTKNNQIGLSLTLLNLNSSYDLAVLEIGTNHPGEIEYLAGICLPNIALITNIGPSHLEHFKGIESVYREKCALMKYLRRPYISVLCADDTFLRKQLEPPRRGHFPARLKTMGGIPPSSKIAGWENVPYGGAKPVSFGFGMKHKSDFTASGIKALRNKLDFVVNGIAKFRINTIGAFNIYNALAAIAVSRIFGLEYKDIIERLSGFSFSRNRLKLIELNKIKFINDTYNSNPLSLREALRALDNFEVKGRKIFVMGDMLELGALAESFHRQAGKMIAKVCDCFVAVGGMSKLSAREARINGLNDKGIFTCASNLEAKDILFKKIAPQACDIVLVKGSRAMMMEEVLDLRL